MSKIKNDYIYNTISFSISFFVSLWIYLKSFFSGYPGFFVGNANATNGLQNLNGLWSNVNFGEAAVQNTWQVVIGKFYYFFTILGIDTILVSAILNFIILYIGFWSIKKVIIDHRGDAVNNIYILFISIGYLFSTFTLMFYEGNIFFVFLLWLLPLNLVILNINIKQRYRLVASFLSILVFASVNLPFGLFLIFINVLYFFFKYNKSLEIKLFILNIFALAISILPSAIYTIINLKYTTGVLSSETFYRNSTSAATVILGITDWGFFGSFASIPYREYASIFTTTFGQLTALAFLVPFIIILLNKYNKKINISILISLFIIFSLVLGDKYLFSSYIYSAFNSLPMSDIFRNSSKFYFLISSLTLILFIFNKNIKIASFIYFVSAIPIFLLFLNGDILQDKSVKSLIFQDYNTLIEKNIIKSDDNVFIYPFQYMPVFLGPKNKNILVYGGYSMAEFFLASNVIYSRCMGCGNPLFKDSLKTMSDVKDIDWVNKINEFGINKIIYDKDAFVKYYPGTIKIDDFNLEVKSKNIPFNKYESGSLIVYSFNEIYPKKITMCDPAWIKFENNTLSRECKKDQVYFYKSDKSFYTVNILMYLQIILSVITLYVIIKFKYENV